ncbi:MAG: type II toxin-antitoxin system RelE/ParE family toxin [Tenericutes bacterium]|nr:type II toxin-antitoxin system RelE/ParE family toxin [Mycoplasmatota bacterium]
MENRFVLLPKAQEDLENIFYYIAVELVNPEAASNLINKFESKFKELLIFPLSYPLIESKLIFQIDLRKCIVDNYIIVYYCNEKNKLVEIVRVIYSKTNYFQDL